MLRGVLLFTPPRRPGLDILTETKADTPTLDALAAAGYRLALITCTPGGLDFVPAQVAATPHLDNGRWRVLDTWPYPDRLRGAHFAALLARGPLCASQSPGEPRPRMIARRVLVALVVLGVTGGLLALLLQVLAPGGWTLAKLAMLAGLLGTAPWTGLCLANGLVGFLRLVATRGQTVAIIPIGLTLDPSAQPRRHAGECRHPRLCLCCRKGSRGCRHSPA